MFASCSGPLDGNHLRTSPMRKFLHLHSSFSVDFSFQLVCRFLVNCVGLIEPEILRGPGTSFPSSIDICRIMRNEKLSDLNGTPLRFLSLVCRRQSFRRAIYDDWFSHNSEEDDTMVKTLLFGEKVPGVPTSK